MRSDRLLPPDACQKYSSLGPPDAAESGEDCPFRRKEGFSGLESRGKRGLEEAEEAS